MKRGLSASSPSAWRIFLTAVLTPCSNSTNVPAGHSACCNSSRGDHLARMSQQQGENLKRLVLEGHLAPPLAQFPGREVTANSGPATEAGPMKALIGSWLLASLGATMLAESRQPGLRIDVLVYNYAGLSAETLARAEGEAARIFERAGIETEWLAGRPAVSGRGGAVSAPPACHRGDTAVPPASLGGDGGASEVRPHDIRLCLGSRGWRIRGDRECVPPRAEELVKGREKLHAVIVGHVRAHELGHLLLGLGSHSASGLMRVRWRKKELELVAKRSLFFLPWQAERMRAQVPERVARERAELMASTR